MQTPILYRIRVRETLNLDIPYWLEDFALFIEANGSSTIVLSVADQPALRGVLNRIWDRNLTVLDVSIQPGGNLENRSIREGENP